MAMEVASVLMPCNDSVMSLQGAKSLSNFIDISINPKNFLFVFCLKYFEP